MHPLLITHPVFACHQVPAGHPERPERYHAVMKAIKHLDHDWTEKQAIQADYKQLEAVHSQVYLDKIFATFENMNSEHEGPTQLDADTFVSQKSLQAALCGVGAACLAVDSVLSGDTNTAFCAMRPPGHHAEPDRAMGFCLFSNAAIAARHAQIKWGIERVAVLDFDVHHGNGTQAAFWSHPNLFYASSHQMPLYPGTGAKTETGAHQNIFNLPCAHGDDGTTILSGWDDYLLPNIVDKGCHLVIISAGFDAHKDDPLAGLRMDTGDFATLTDRYIDAFAGNAKIISVLEGGYNLEALQASVQAHLDVLASKLS